MAGTHIHPPKFEGDFTVWKKKMEVFFRTDFDILLSIKYGFAVPKDTNGDEKEEILWNKKEQSESVANGKAEFHLLTVLPTKEVNRIGTYHSAKELWEKFLELHEGTSEVKSARKDLLRNQLTNLRMVEGETVAELHAKIKELISGLTQLGESVSNRDSIRYALNAFPRTQEWSTIVDAYYISKDLEVSTLDEMFSIFELHESRCVGSRKRDNIALNTRRTEKGSESSTDDEETTQMVRTFKSFFKANKFSRMQKTRRSPKKRTVRCYNCNEEGHLKDQCPKLKNQPKRKKALKATWDETSSDESETQEYAGLALMASHQEESTDEGGATSEESNDEGGASLFESDPVSEVCFLPHDQLYAGIKAMLKANCKLEKENS